MATSEYREDVSMQGEEVPRIVSFYMTTKSPQVRIDGSANKPGIMIVNHEIDDSRGIAKATRAVRCSFDPRASVETPPCLLSFGSDPDVNGVILDPGIASPVHCRLYGQLNSGHNVLIIEDLSHNGTSYHGVSEYRDTEGKSIHSTGIVRQGCKAVVGLKSLSIGSYVFNFHPPKLATETEERDRWFRRNEPLLVTKALLQQQLHGTIMHFMSLGQFGEGGQGEVFKCMETHTGLLIAVKVQKVGGDSQALRQEIKTMKLLQHPQLAHCIDSVADGHNGQVAWRLIMPLYRENLLDALPGMRFPVKRRFMCQLATAVTYIHARGFLHRDIKPANAFIAGKSPANVVLGDLGLAATMRDKSRGVGTEHYVAPELINGTHHPITAAVDVYSLGVTFLVMVDWERVVKYGLEMCLSDIKVNVPSAYPRLIQQMIDSDYRLRPEMNIVQQALDFDKDVADPEERTAYAPAPAQVALPTSPMPRSPFGTPPPPYEDKASTALYPPAQGKQKFTQIRHTPLMPPARPQPHALDLVHKARGRDVVNLLKVTRGFSPDVDWLPIATGMKAIAPLKPTPAPPHWKPLVEPEKSALTSSALDVDFSEPRAESKNTFTQQRVELLEAEIREREAQIREREAYIREREAHLREEQLRHCETKRRYRVLRSSLKRKRGCDESRRKRMPGEWPSQPMFPNSGSFSCLSEISDDPSSRSHEESFSNGIGESSSGNLSRTNPDTNLSREIIERPRHVAKARIKKHLRRNEPGISNDDYSEIPEVGVLSRSRRPKKRRLD